MKLFFKRGKGYPNMICGGIHNYKEGESVVVNGSLFIIDSIKTYHKRPDCGKLYLRPPSVLELLTGITDNLWRYVRFEAGHRLNRAKRRLRARRLKSL